MLEKQVVNLSIAIVIVLLCSAEKVKILSPERPAVVYVNPAYVTYANMTSRRQGRNNPIYYVSVNFNAVVYFGNNVTVSFYMFEYRSGNYIRTFIDFHFKFCDFINKDMLFGAQMRQGKLAQSCPYPPGEYQNSNMTFQQENIPPGFPKTKSRIWVNLTTTATRVLIVASHIDVEVREIDIKRRKKQK